MTFKYRRNYLILLKVIKNSFPPFGSSKSRHIPYALFVFPVTDQEFGILVGHSVMKKQSTNPPFLLLGRNQHLQNPFSLRKL